MKKTKTYDQQTAKFIAVLVQNLPDLSGEAMQNWIENPSGLKRVLMAVLCPTRKKKIFEKWITIRLGTGPKNALDFCDIFSDRRMKIEHWAKNLLSKTAFTVADKETEVDLVSVATFELGFKTFISREEIYKRAEELGLELCPAEVGPQLALQYEGQFEGEWIMIAMEPLASPDGTSEIFSVRCENSKLMLCAYDSKPDKEWHSEQQWVFVLPRK